MLSEALLKQIRIVATEHPSIVATITKFLTEANSAGYDGSLKGRLLGHISNRQAFFVVSEMLRVWQVELSSIGSRDIAIALITAEYCHRESALALNIELTWTGPQNLNVPMRRTDQALVELIDRAEKRLTIVSFAVYKITEIVTALTRAIERKVEIGMIVETAESSDGKVTSDLRQAFGNEVLKHSNIYVWPLEKRVRDESGHYGALHAKCAVADSKYVCLSSANFTDFAMKLNIEMGLLITNESLARKIEAQFNGLISNGVLVRRMNI